MWLKLCKMFITLIIIGGGCPSCHTHFCYVCFHHCVEDPTIWQGCPGMNAGEHGLFCDDRCDCTLCPDCSPGNSCNNCDGCPACMP